MQKGFCPKQGKSLKIYTIFRFSCKPRGLFHLPENTFLKKVLQKRLNTKIFISDKPEFCGAIGAGLFAVDSDRLLERLECNALNINPKNLVILIGTNNIGIGVPTEYTLKNIKEILQRTQTLCSNTNIVLQAIYPVNSHLSIIGRQMVGKRSNKKILAINKELHKIALDSKVQWLDLTKVLSDERGRLAKEYCYDGLHLNAQGFEIVSENIIPLLK